MEKGNKDIELRSEEVQEVMGQVPAWIVRWGITLLFLVVVALLVGSCFFMLIIPTFDVVRVVLHRIRNRKPIFDADKSHIHHKILAMVYNQHYTLF